ncbi:MAG: hypothetical protein U0470_12915 [Anaerolineae bacterium]
MATAAHRRPRHIARSRQIARSRVLAPAAATLFAAAALLLPAGRSPHPAAAHPALQAAKGCVARSTRDFFRSATRITAVGWGEPVDVELSVEVDCGFAGADALEGFAVTETLPAGLTLSPFAEDEKPTAFTSSTAVWRFDDLNAESRDTGGSLSRRVRYRLRPAPVDPPVSASGETRIQWPTAFGARLSGAWRPLGAVLDVPLAVVVRRADADCKLAASRRYAPAAAQPGDTIEATLSPDAARLLGVPGPDERHDRPPAAPRCAVDVERSVTTAGAWYDPPTGRMGSTACVERRAVPGDRAADARDSNTLTAPIRAWRGERGGTAAPPR